MSIFVCVLYCRFFFFFQAEDGIRDLYVTGVQTCALPISRIAHLLPAYAVAPFAPFMPDVDAMLTMSPSPFAFMCGTTRLVMSTAPNRSEERRVGKECRSGWSRGH